MDLKEEIKAYIEKYGDSASHTFSDGTKVVNQKLSHFLINWYNQSVYEWDNFKTTHNADAIKKLIS